MFYFYINIYHSRNGAKNLPDLTNPIFFGGSFLFGEKLILFDNSLISYRFVEELQRVLSSLKKLALGLKKFLITFFRYYNKQVGCKVPSSRFSIDLLVYVSPCCSQRSPRIKLLKKCCSSSVSAIVSDCLSKTDEFSS